MGKANILWVDNDPGPIQDNIRYLQDSGYSVKVATTPRQCLSSVEEQEFDLAILDIYIPHTDELDSTQTMGGSRTGVALASRIRSISPNTKLVGCSLRSDPDVKAWFADFGASFWLKSDIRNGRALLALVERTLGHPEIQPRIFIVHGHDEAAKYSLKSFLQNNLGLDEPVILHEMPSQGKTIIEKLEEEALKTDIVFVLLTPDDVGTQVASSNIERRRARQNVIFELGLFYGILGRKSGRIFLLHKGSLELPSDIDGVVYIDITNGVESAGEHIRRELRSLL